MAVLKGVLLLARFRAEGFAEFAATPAAFMNSLAPMIGISLVAGLPPLLGGHLRAFLVHALTSAIAMLCPPVLSHALAWLWKREPAWLRYAVAYNWCQTAITLAAMALVLGFVAGSGGRGGAAATMASVVVLLAYWLVIGWFLAWRGLGVGGAKAALAVLVINFGTGLAVLLPQLLALGWRGVPALPGAS